MKIPDLSIPRQGGPLLICSGVKTLPAARYSKTCKRKLFRHMLYNLLTLHLEVKKGKSKKILRSTSQLSTYWRAWSNIFPKSIFTIFSNSKWMTREISQHLNEGKKMHKHYAISKYGHWTEVTKFTLVLSEHFKPHHKKNHTSEYNARIMLFRKTLTRSCFQPLRKPPQFSIIRKGTHSFR